MIDILVWNQHGMKLIGGISMEEANRADEEEESGKEEPQEEFLIPPEEQSYVESFDLIPAVPNFWTMRDVHFIVRKPVDKSEASAIVRFNKSLSSLQITEVLHHLAMCDEKMIDVCSCTQISPFRKDQLIWKELNW